MVSNNLIYQDFIDLFDPEDPVRFKALLLKKHWILDKFYIPYPLETDKDGHCAGIDYLLHSCLYFHKAHYRQIETTESKGLVDAFNEKFKYIKLYTSLPIRKDKNWFFVEVDFHKLDKADYRKLVASFFYCLPPETFKTKFPSKDIRTLFQRPMEGERGEGVLIMDKTALNDGKLEVDGFKRIYIYSDMSDKEKDVLENVAKKMNMRCHHVSV